MKLSTRIMGLISGLLVSPAVFAAGSGGESVAGLGLFGAGLAIGIAAFGAASGQGKAASSALEGIARNPGARGEVFGPLILALAFMELQAFLGFVIAIFIING